MKAPLLTRAATALVLGATLAGGVGTASFAQSTAPSGGAPPATAAAPVTTPSGTATPGDAAPGTTGATAPGTTSTMHHTTATHTRSAARSTPGETMQQMAEQRIKDLHARLHITAQQQSQWDAFAQVMRENAKHLDQAYQQRAASFNSMNAVENMQSYAKIEQTRAQDMQKLVPAFQTLYSALSDQQKQDADAMFRNQAAKAQQRHAAVKH